MYITCQSCSDVQLTQHKSSSVHQDESEALSVAEKFAAWCVVDLLITLPMSMVNMAKP